MLLKKMLSTITMLFVGIFMIQQSTFANDSINYFKMKTDQKQHWNEAQEAAGQKFLSFSKEKQIRILEKKLKQIEKTERRLNKISDQKYQTLYSKVKNNQQLTIVDSVPGDDLASSEESAIFAAAEQSLISNNVELPNVNPNLMFNSAKLGNKTEVLKTLSSTKSELKKTLTEIKSNSGSNTSAEVMLAAKNNSEITKKMFAFVGILILIYAIVFFILKGIFGLSLFTWVIPGLVIIGLLIWLANLSLY